jgi:hypothetical protein
MNTSNNIERTAIISTCGHYRYKLGRRWAECPTVLWIMLNPSTADASTDDATIRRCIKYSRALGFGALLVGNLYPLRATNPRKLIPYAKTIAQIRNAPTLQTHDETVYEVPEGATETHRSNIYNAEYVRQMSEESAAIICAWGANPLAAHGKKFVYDMRSRRATFCLGLTSGGAPFHPLQRTQKLTINSCGDLVPFYATQRLA